MQPQSGDVVGTIVEAALDAALVAGTCAYAVWLDEHKDLEPDHTYAEVVGGVALCLIQAYCREKWTGMEGRRSIWRALALGGTPVVMGELNQWRKRRAARSNYKKSRGRPSYPDLMQ